MVIFKKFYNHTLEIPRGVCPSCWDNRLNDKIKNLLEENKIKISNHPKSLAFTIDHIKNFERGSILKNNNGNMFCQKCKTTHENYDYIELQRSTS